MPAQLSKRTERKTNEQKFKWHVCPYLKLWWLIFFFIDINVQFVLLQHTMLIEKDVSKDSLLMSLYFIIQGQGTDTSPFLQMHQMKFFLTQAWIPEKMHASLISFTSFKKYHKSKRLFSCYTNHLNYTPYDTIVLFYLLLFQCVKTVL